MNYFKSCASQINRAQSASDATMRKVLYLAGMATLIGLNVGFVMILIFLYHKWGGLGFLKEE